jgi:hypothetical protein
LAFAPITRLLLGLALLLAADRLEAAGHAPTLSFVPDQYTQNSTHFT